MPSCLILGAGVVGLSLAYELARRAWQVRILDRQTYGREASWAGAGILPPTNSATALHPLDRLRALSHEMHLDWAARLQAETGIDNGLRHCGAIYLARTPGEMALLAGMSEAMAEEQITCRRLTLSELRALEPNIAIDNSLRAAYQLPDECQLRNPRHLQALAAACRKLGVEILENCEVLSFQAEGENVASVQTTSGEMHADHYAITSGPWTQRLLSDLGHPTGLLPIRGQMMLFRAERVPFTHIVNEGPRYLVPREDGYVLAGSTEEEVGFDKSNTEEGLAELSHFARSLIPALATATIERTWAGLRPATFDGFPYIGRVPGQTNLFVAAGHFRSGLHMSPGTALVLAQLMSNESTAIDLTPFRVARG